MLEYSSSPVGSLTPIVVFDPREDQPIDHWAFVPKPLPQSLDLSQSTWSTAMNAALAIGRLDAATQQLPNPSLLVRPAIRTEAVSTSALEGTYAELDEVLEAELLGDAQASSDVREIRNYIRAAEHAITLLQARPISINMIAELQAILVRGTRGDSYQAGAVRQKQVWIGPHDCKVTDARFVPPPPGDLLLDGISKWERWIHQATPALIIRIAAGHYQFETLHPFHDGNGRLGRLLTVLQLIAEGALQHPVLYISPYLEARRDEYVDLLAATSRTGDFDAWVSFFSKALEHQAGEAVHRTQRLLESRATMVARLRQEGVRGAAIPITESLIGYPILNVQTAAETAGVSYQAANKAVARLTALGILTQVSDGPYDRIFAAPAVMKIIRP